MKNPMAGWVPEEFAFPKTTQEQARLREISLPPGLRSNKRLNRELRDAYLGQFLLQDTLIWALMTKPTGGQRTLEMIRQRENMRLELKKTAEDLELDMKPEDIAWAKEAAKTLFEWTQDQQRRQGRGKK